MNPETCPRESIAAVGITNQRESVVMWHRYSGAPFYNAIIWNDTRGTPACEDLIARGGQEQFRPKTGLPVNTYFSGEGAGVFGARHRCVRQRVCGTRMCSHEDSMDS